jgi:phage N-6-adenine-methyltransferase
MSDDTDFWEVSDSGVEWSTPPWLVLPLARAVGGYDLDAASGAEDRPYADDVLTEDDDALTTPWRGRVWINPPYGRTENPTWADRITDQAESDDVQSITALIPSNTGTSWFGDYYASDADALTFIHTRIQFGDAANGATFASAIAHFGVFPDYYWDAIDNLTDDDGDTVPTTTVRLTEDSDE